MKKFFTLIATSVMALTASASTMVPLNLSSWGGDCVVDGTTITYGNAWEGAGSWIAVWHEDESVTGLDLSDCEYMWFTFAEGSTVDVKVVLQYTDQYVDGAAGTSSVSVLSGSVVAGFTLDPALKNDIYQFFVQSTSGAGSITLTGAFAGSKDEYDAAMAGDMSVKEKDFALPGDNGVVVMSEGEDNAGWYASSWIGMENLATLGFKSFVVEIESADAPFQVLAQDWPGGEQRAQGFEAITSPIKVVYPLVEGTLTGLGQFALQNMNITDSWMDPASGKEVSWYDANKVVVTRAYLTSEDLDPASVQNVNVTVNNNVMYNVAGQRINKANGLYIMNGKKYFAK